MDQDTFFRLEEIVGYKDHVAKIVPSKIRVIGRMFYSDRIHRDARPDASAHCGIDLTHVRSFNLREMRDIRLNERTDIEYASHEFEMLDMHLTPDGFRQDKYITYTQEIKVGAIISFTYFFREIQNLSKTVSPDFQNFENLNLIELSDFLNTFENSFFSKI